MHEKHVLYVSQVSPPQTNKLVWLSKILLCIISHSNKMKLLCILDRIFLKSLQPQTEPRPQKFQHNCDWDHISLSRTWFSEISKIITRQLF